MSKFYTNVTLIRNDIYVRGYENGQRVQHVVPYKPYLFVHSKGVTSTKYRNLQGKAVDKLEFDSISEARDFIKRQANSWSVSPACGSVVSSLIIFPLYM